MGWRATRPEGFYGLSQMPEPGTRAEAMEVGEEDRQQGHVLGSDGALRQLSEGHRRSRGDALGQAPGGQSQTHTAGEGPVAMSSRR